MKLEESIYDSADYIFAHTNDDELEFLWITEKNYRSRICLYQYIIDPEIIYIANFSVNEDLRGQGLGREILKVAEETAKQQGVSSIMLCVDPNSWVHSWYLRLGYQDYQEEYEENLIWMIKIIKE